MSFRPQGEGDSKTNDPSGAGGSDSPTANLKRALEQAVGSSVGNESCVEFIKREEEESDDEGDVAAIEALLLRHA